MDENGEQLGIMSAAQAQSLADDRQLDLVKIAPQGQPPVCKILQNGDKVKVTIRFRGRQLSFTNRGVEIMNGFYEMVKDHATVERKPLMEGRNMVMILAPANN